ncbi:MAG: IgGFc-binding protein [Myxococcota bacterium]
MGLAAAATRVLALTLITGCGRSGLYFPPPELRSCVEDPSSSLGCSFLVGPGLHVVDSVFETAGMDPSEREPDGVFVVNPDRDQIVTIQAFEIPAGDTEARPLGDPLALPPGESGLVQLPLNADRSTTERRAGGLVHLHADAPFAASVHGPYRPFLGNDSSLLLPDAKLGRRYVVAAYPPHFLHFQGAGEPSFFEVIALEDATRVRWRPRLTRTVAATDQIPAVDAGQWSPQIILDRHETLLVTASALVGSEHEQRDISGTLIESSSPVRVTGGSRCSAVPITFEPLGGCDPLYEQLVPVEAWGRTYVIAHPPLRTDEDHHVRIYAGASNITLKTEPPVLPTEPYVLAEEGAFIDVVVDHGTSFVLTADGPVMPVGYLQTRNPDLQIGDPAMYQFVSAEQYLDRYVIATGTQWEAYLVQVVRRRGTTEIELDGGEVLDGWEPIGAWEVASVSISEGAHTLRSDEPFGVIQFGWNNSRHDACIPFAVRGSCQTSYAHPGGMGTTLLQ